MTIFNHVGFAEGKTVAPILEQINGATRYYKTPDGAKYPSITSVLGASPAKKVALGEWANKVGHNEANRIKREAADRGTHIHKLAEDYLNNLTPDTSTLKDNFVYLEMWKNFTPVLNRIDTIHCQEARLFSHYLKMAGTVDCIGKFDGRLSIIDFKTSTKYKKKEWIKDYFMQCAAYAIMYEELTSIPIDTLAVLISVENNDPLVYIERRDDWVRPLLEARQFYAETVENS